MFNENEIQNSTIFSPEACYARVENPCHYGRPTMSDPWRTNVFGVRHLSPAGAWHLRRYLDALRPEIVLIEGLSDAGPLLPHVTDPGTKPPIAILAYTESLPVRTLVYPLSRYCAEFQAIVWAKENSAR